MVFIETENTCGHDMLQNYFLNNKFQQNSELTEALVPIFRMS